MKTQIDEEKSRQCQLIARLCETAVKGLMNGYSGRRVSEQDSCLDHRETPLNMASHLRYIIIAQIGIRHWLGSCTDNTELPDFWKHIISRGDEISNPGDLGLAIWAGVESGVDDNRRFAERLVEDWAHQQAACNAVELAWVVQGMTLFSQHHSMTGEMTFVLKDARDQLHGLYCDGTGLFARHNRRTKREFLSRRIACFADQVYPILALAEYGRNFNDQKSIETAVAVADTICRLQGSKGQWWWHYDVKTGTVAEEYPVFSVHQDGMAPMALLAIDRVAGTNHSVFIEKGLKWLDGHNELEAVLIMPEAGVIWRDIHRREAGKMYRLVRGVLAAKGWCTAHRLSRQNLFGYVVNRECRPYHLGWILYAWARQ